MVRAKKVKPGGLTRSSVARLLRAHGLSQRPRMLPERERRAFTVELPNDLWMGDGMEGPPVIGHDGKLHNKPRMLSQIDVASRFAIYSEFFVTEDAPHQESGLTLTASPQPPSRPSFFRQHAATPLLLQKIGTLSSLCPHSRKMCANLPLR